MTLGERLRRRWREDDEETTGYVRPLVWGCKRDEGQDGGDDDGCTDADRSSQQ